MRCPRCGTAELSIVEKSDAFTTFDQDADGRIVPAGFNSHGLITGLSARCGPCKHHWRVRGASQITDVAGYEAPAPPTTPPTKETT